MKIDIGENIHTWRNRMQRNMGKNPNINSACSAVYFSSVYVTYFQYGNDPIWKIFGDCFTP
jgi:hypothetical protein